MAVASSAIYARACFRRPTLLTPSTSTWIVLSPFWPFSGDCLHFLLLRSILSFLKSQRCSTDREKSRRWIAAKQIYVFCSILVTILYHNFRYKIPRFSTQRNKSLAKKSRDSAWRTVVDCTWSLGRMGHLHVYLGPLNGYAFDILRFSSLETTFACLPILFHSPSGKVFLKVFFSILKLAGKNSVFVVFIKVIDRLCREYCLGMARH